MRIKDWIKNSKLAKFIPFKLKRTLVFNSFGQRIDSKPVIIFHDTEQNYYYYIKTRDARLDNGWLTKYINAEILFPKSNKPNTLFKKDFYLDCSQIFYIHDSQLEELTKKYPQTEILDSKELEFDQVEKMFNRIYECLRLYTQPFIVISKVSYDSKTKITKSEVQYASDWNLEHEYSHVIKKTNKTKKIKKLEELKDKLKKDKDIVYVENFEIAFRKAWREYNEEKIYNLLFDWISEKRFIQRGLNSLEIIQKYKARLNPIVPINVDAVIIFASMFKKRDLAYELLATDYKFMLDWFKKNDLDMSMESFMQFRKSIQHAQGLTEVFYYDKLENQLEQDLSQLEEKHQQSQNQKIIRVELTYQNARLLAEKLIQDEDDEEEWLKSEVEEFKKFVAELK
ncbi:Mbov_0400 family ICE element protein [Mesomycoplasma ovipneumoniae]|uniref:Mbov_0400 family ICE element protein n=1 Tax=Mesomycoplasma ovipneumoniae TaxID=29562 RepID=UPI00307FE7FA